MLKIEACFFRVVVSGHGLALLDELAKPEIEAGQLERVSEVFLTNFAYYLVPGVGRQLYASALGFQSWLKGRDFRI